MSIVQEQRGRNGKILVVDDDRLVLATLAHGLTEAGYEVIDADNGDDAILLAREHRPDLALLDIRMEGMSGFDVAAYLREYCKMPFMFLSAFSDDDTVRQVHELGAVDYLVKPLDIGHIVPAVQAVFARLRATSGAAVSVEAPKLQPSAPLTDALKPVEAMAVGVLMHRFSLTRAAALERLQRMSTSNGRATADESERVLQAVELLSGSADH